MTHIIFLFILFFLLTPGILLRLPSKGNKWIVAFVHALVFGILVYVSCRWLNIKEGNHGCRNFSYWSKTSKKCVTD